MKTAVVRGLKGRCPNCGQGALFHGYIRQVESCSHCSADLGQYRADDGPSWLSVLLTGPVAMPVTLILLTQTGLPAWIATALAMLFATLTVLILLPRMKGFFISVLWLSKIQIEPITQAYKPVSCGFMFNALVSRSS